jgi:hypothetical protein
MRHMEDRNNTNRRDARDVSCGTTRDGKRGEIGGRYWSTRDELTGELTFHVELPNVVRHFQEDFDVCILVIAWSLWGLAGKEKVWFRDGFGLSEEEKAAAFWNTTRFIGCGIEAWLSEQGKLAFAEGIVDRDGNFRS